jgi:glutathione synthase/RimK-type ligase-like ATP-grasp enzyme
MQANVSIPYIYLTHDEWLEAGCPQILQKPEYGQAGRGIKLVEPRAFQYNYIYQKYIPKTREFRVAIVGNIFAYAMEKLPPTDADEIRWNQCRGSEWTQVHDLRSLTPKFVRLGGAGLRALGYDFGGMDIIMDADGTLYILEINSKPGVGEVNSRKLADALKCYIQEG